MSTCVPASLKAFDDESCANSSKAASPAQKAGIQSGDKIIAVAGTPVHNWTQLGTVIRAQPAGQARADDGAAGWQADHP